MINTGSRGCVRLHLNQRTPIRMTVDDQQVVAREGETVMTALLASLAYVHNFEFYSERRAGFCMMGACQDCWLWRRNGERLQACTSLVEQDMKLSTVAPETVR